MSEHNGQLPNSKKTYVSGRLHPDIRVPFREISLAPTKSINGEIEINEPVRVYDTSGPWGDPDFHGDVTQGLPPLRAKWIRERGDIEEINGRATSAARRRIPIRSSSRERERARRQVEDSKFKQSSFAPTPKPLASDRLASASRNFRTQGAGNHHAGNGIHRDPRKSWTRKRVASNIERSEHRT